MPKCLTHKRFMWRAGCEETTRLAKQVTMMDERLFSAKAVTYSGVGRSSELTTTFSLFDSQAVSAYL